MFCGHIVFMLIKSRVLFHFKVGTPALCDKNTSVCVSASFCLPGNVKATGAQCALLMLPSVCVCVCVVDLIKSQLHLLARVSIEITP